jgi:hypothetical protein
VALKNINSFCLISSKALAVFSDACATYFTLEISASKATDALFALPATDYALSETAR